MASTAVMNPIGETILVKCLGSDLNRKLPANSE